MKINDNHGIDLKGAPQDKILPALLPREHPLLRQVAAPALDFQAQDFQNFLDTLLKCVEVYQGVGIAAPQIGASYRVFILAPAPSTRYPDSPILPPTPMVNPTVVWKSDETVKGWEGCLSVPGFRGLVPRHESIEIDYFERTGERKQVRYEGFVARIIQHELDHLDGILFPDRMLPEDKLLNISEYEAATGLTVSA